VILNDVGPEIMAEGLAAIMTYIGRPPTHRTLAEAAGAMPAAYAESFRTCRPRPGPPSPAASSPRTRRACTCATTRACGRPWRPAFAPDAVAPDLWPLFDAFAGLPLGLIRGANSNLLSVETADEMRRRRPDMVYGEVPIAATCPSSTSRRRRR
jgi:hypothetical protein